MFNTNAFVQKIIKSLHDMNFKIVFHINHATRDIFGSLIASDANSERINESPLSRPTDTLPPRPTRGEGRVRGGAALDSPLHIRNYWARHRDTFALGVDGWWPDDGDELPIEARLTRHRCYYQGPLLDRTNSRPWSLHRNGYAGVPRYGGWILCGHKIWRLGTLAANGAGGLHFFLGSSPFSV